MQNPNLFGLFLTTQVSAELNSIHEDLRRIREEVGELMTRTVLAFVGQPISPETMFEFEKELAWLLLEEGRRIMASSIPARQGSS